MSLAYVIPSLTMPMSAPHAEDQQAARTFKSTLQDAVERQERLLVELDWFLPLSSRIRTSGRLLCLVMAQSRVLLEYIRADWARARTTNQEYEEQLACARAQPWDFECLQGPDDGAWQGFGRRKERCRRFNTIGRAHSLRNRLAHAEQRAEAAEQFTEAPILSVDAPRDRSLSPTRMPGVLLRH